VDVLGDHDRSTECETGAVLVPDSVMTMAPFVALLATVMLPETAPVLAGEKVAVKLAD